jgi:hypothetical protein
MTGATPRGALFRGLALATLHLLIVSSLGAKLLYDRATRPRVWVEAAPYDPDMPIRGRYVSLRLLVDASDLIPPVRDIDRWATYPVTLHAEKDRLVARYDRDEANLDRPAVRFESRGDAMAPVLVDPVAFFIPEHVEDPSRRPAGESLWVEVTIPRTGAPRPIRLGVRRDGAIAPLGLD